MRFHLISLPMDDLIYFLFKDSLLAIDLSLTEHLQDLLGLPIPDSTQDGLFEAKQVEHVISDIVACAFRRIDFISTFLQVLQISEIIFIAHPFEYLLIIQPFISAQSNPSKQENPDGQQDDSYGQIDFIPGFLLVSMDAEHISRNKKDRRDYKISEDDAQEPSSDELRELAEFEKPELADPIKHEYLDSEEGNDDGADHAKERAVQEIGHQKGISRRNIEFRILILTNDGSHSFSLFCTMSVSQDNIPQTFNLHNDLLHQFSRLEGHQGDGKDGTELIFVGSSGYSLAPEVISIPEIVYSNGGEDYTQSCACEPSVVFIDLVGSYQSLLLAAYCDFKEDPKKGVDEIDAN